MKLAEFYALDPVDQVTSLMDVVIAVQESGEEQELGVVSAAIRFPQLLPQQTGE